MDKSGRLELGDNILWTYIHLQPLWYNWPAKQSDRRTDGQTDRQNSHR